MGIFSALRRSRSQQPAELSESEIRFLHAAAVELQREHAPAQVFPYGPEYLVVDRDPRDVRLAAPAVTAAVERGDLAIETGPRAVPYSALRTHAPTGVGAYRWVRINPGIRDAAHDWLTARLAPDLTGDAACDAAWEHLVEFSHERWAPGPAPVIVVGAVAVLDDYDPMNVLRHEAERGFDRVLAQRGSQMVDEDWLYSTPDDVASGSNRGPRSLLPGP